MKIFEITKINEVDVSQLSTQIQGLIANISSKVQRLTATGDTDTGPSTRGGERGAGNSDTGPSTRGGARGDNAGRSGNADQMIIDAAEKVRSGEAQLSKDADAELGKRGADPQDIHIAVVSKQQAAARALLEQIAEATGLSGGRLMRYRDEADLKIKLALFGYINKKYLGGDDTNFRANTMDIIRRALQSQAPVGGQQPIGRVSSSRAAGERGTVGSGGGTNALDAMAADRDF